MESRYERATIAFQHERLDSDPPCGQLAFCLTEDLTGNGRPDVIVGGLGARKVVHPFGKRIKLRDVPGIGDLIRRLEWNVFWYENPGWERHEIAKSHDLSIGASLGDLTGNGRADLVVGQNLDADLYWFEQPSDPRETWSRHLITDEFLKYHDTAVGDVDDDGEPEVVVLSQRSETVFYYDIPPDPRQSPWPDEYRHTIADGLNVEGASITDIDGDGRAELLAGANVFHRSNGSWEREVIADDWEWTRLAVADLDGDGQQEVLMTEGDLPYQGDRHGRLGWFDPPDWTPTVLADDLFCPHTLQTADFTGNGRPDVYVAEMGLGDNDDPIHAVYLNQGDATFEREVIARGVPTHEAKVADLTGDGRPDIVGKPYTPRHHVDAWLHAD